MVTGAGRRKLPLLLRLIRLRAELMRLTWLTVDGCLSRGESIPGTTDEEWWRELTVTGALDPEG
jgi:hypothetical protein